MIGIIIFLILGMRKFFTTTKGKARLVKLACRADTSKYSKAHALRTATYLTGAHRDTTDLNTRKVYHSKPRRVKLSRL